MVDQHALHHPPLQHTPTLHTTAQIDALMMARGAEGEHEASRRMKTELLIQVGTCGRPPCRVVPGLCVPLLLNALAMNYQPLCNSH